MADPGMPSRAAAIADDLADDLTCEARRPVAVESSQNPRSPDGEIRLTEHAPRLLQEHEASVLYLTDCPRVPGGPLLYDVSGSRAAALVSPPVLGVFRVRSKVRRLALSWWVPVFIRKGWARPASTAPPSTARPPGRLLGAWCATTGPPA